MDPDFEDEISKLTSELDQHGDFLEGEEEHHRPTSAPPSSYDITTNLFGFNHGNFDHGQNAFESSLPAFQPFTPINHGDGLNPQMRSLPIDLRQRTHSIENFLSNSPGSILSQRKPFGGMSKGDEGLGFSVGEEEEEAKDMKKRMDALNLNPGSDDDAMSRFFSSDFKSGSADFGIHNRGSSLNPSRQNDDHSQSFHGMHMNSSGDFLGTASSSMSNNVEDRSQYQYQPNVYGNSMMYYPQSQTGASSYAGQTGGQQMSPAYSGANSQMGFNQWGNVNMNQAPRQPAAAQHKYPNPAGHGKRGKAPGGKGRMNAGNGAQQTPQQYRPSANAANTTAPAEAAQGMSPIISVSVPLEHYASNIFHLSQEQNGCRYLQQKVETEGVEACKLILLELLPRLTVLMMDPFGNYLFQKLVEHASVEQRQMMLDQVKSNLVSAALNLHGTRSVQKFIEVCGGKHPQLDQLDLVIDQLRGHVTKMSMDTNGNHVVQRCLQFIPADRCGFVYDAVIEDVMTITRHRHGCCVFQRCIDAADPERRKSLIDRVVEHAIELMQDPFGNYVVQYVLEQAKPGEASRLILQLPGKLTELSKQKFSSNVVEKCLQHATHVELEPLIQEICKSQVTKTLLNDQFANYVVQRALEVADDSQGMRLVQAIRPHMANLNAVNASCARRVSSRIVKRFPHLATDKLFSGYIQKDPKY